MKTYTRNLNCILCALAMMLGLFLLSNKSNAQSQGANSPVWVLNVNSMCMTCSGASWSNMTNGEIIDSNYSVATLKPNGTCNSTSCYYSREYTPSEYNFNIPVFATITGIEVQILKKASNDSAVIDNLTQLMNDDTAVGVSKALPGYWIKANSMYTYGGSTDLWGYNWMPAMINSQNFGVWFKAENRSSSQQKAYIDWIGITVYYTTTTTDINIISATSSNTIGVNYNSLNNNLILSSNFPETIPSSTITVFNMLGQVQFKKELSNLAKGNNIIDIKTPLTPGIYMVEFAGGGKDMVKKMVVVK
jgi:hypothetical protein